MKSGNAHMPSRVLVKMLLLAIIMATSGAHAGMYKYTDEKGRVHYTDKPPSNVTSHVVNTRINTYSSSLPSKQDSAGSHTSGKRKTVTIYTASWCGVCTKAIAYMRKNGIVFTEYDIEKSSKGRRDYKRMKGRGVPIILVGNMRMNGFNQRKFEQMIEQ